MEADVSAAERRAWMESTPAGAVARAAGASGDIDYDAVDAEVEAICKRHERRYGRRLDDSEVAAVRIGAEQRSVVPAARVLSSRVPELVDQVNSANVTAGWSYVPEFRGSSSGIAMLQDGRWSGDPAVVEATVAGEEAKRQRAEADREAWRNGPAVMRTIARPT